MRILLQNRHDARQRPGGDTVVVEAIGAFLTSVGHSVEISSQPEPPLAGFDLVHIFNLTRPHESLAQARNARRQETPYDLTPIYWDLVGSIPWHAYEWPRSWRIAVTPRLLRQGRGWSRKGDERRAQAETLRHARKIFPSSEAEARQLRKQFPGQVEPARMQVLPHGVDLDASCESQRPDRTADAGSIVCAGAIGPRKNQLGLARALRNAPGLRLSLIGDPGLGCEGYARAVRGAIGSNASIESAIPRSRLIERLPGFRALAQPSFIETPGLAALEARSLGLPVIVADVDPVRETFGRDDRVFYCDPSSPISIRRACERAVLVEQESSNRFASAHNWTIVLRPLARAYEQI